MGRPISKKFFGPLTGSTGIGSGDGYSGSGHDLTSGYGLKYSGYNIPVYKARIIGGDMDIGGDAASTPYIISQKGTKKYRVQTSDGAGNCYLVNDDGSSGIGEGEMVIVGYLGGDSGGSSPIPIAKIAKHYAVDFNGNRYKWYVTNGVGSDSSLANVLALVAATSTAVGGDKI